jgi:hypothetical protein
MALKASDFPTAAANVFLGFSIMVIGLMFRDRFAANLLYVTDNKDVYLLVVRIGFVFLTNGMINIEEVNAKNLAKATRSKSANLYFKSSRR